MLVRTRPKPVKLMLLLMRMKPRPAKLMSRRPRLHSWLLKAKITLEAARQEG